MDTVRHSALAANSGVDSLAAAAAGLVVGLSLGEAWQALRWLLAVLCGH
jgi:hypothetical protein